MKTSLIKVFVVLIAGAVAGFCAEQIPGVNPQELDRVIKALPEKATVKPQKPRQVLVFNLTRGFKHDSIPIGAKTIELLGEKTGAYKTVVSEDIGMFEPDKLNQFDAVVMNNTTGELFLPSNLKQLSAEGQKAAQERSDRLKKSLLDFVSGGKGIIGIHAATDCFYKWPEYGEMMGGYFNGHPWGKVIVKIDDPTHPINAAFKGEGFEISDEIYTFKAPYSRENLRVLLSVDWDKSVQKLNLKGGNRADNDYALSWVRQWGKGRVFYCAFGHNHATFWNPKILQHLLDGIQFALGDLPADTTPSAKLKK